MQDLLKLTSTFAVCKNWNSYGTIVGAALCQLSSVLGSLESGAIGPLIDGTKTWPFLEFQQVIPLGNALMGQKHGHSEIVYVKYMVSVAEEPAVMVIVNSRTTQEERPCNSFTIN